MKIGVSGLLWSTRIGPDQLSLLPRLRSSGFDSFEIPVFQPGELPVAALRSALRASELECSVCAILPRGLSPIDPDAAIRAKTLAHLEECVRVSADLGARLMAGPLYAPVGYLTGRRRTEEQWKLAVDCFQSLSKTLDEFSIDLALEPLNRFETFFMTTVDEASRFCAAVGHPRIGILLDTFHTNIEEKDVPNAFLSANGQLKHVHIGENDRGIPGTGHTDFSGILKALEQIGYPGSLVIESFGYRLPELAAATAIWRDLAPDPESIAFEGIRYLRSLETS